MIIEGRIFQFSFLILYSISTLIFIYLIKTDVFKIPTVRKIVPIEAIPEAIGRAVEMGRPVHFCTGFKSYITSSKSAYTIAGLSVLSRVAELSAEYGARLICSPSTGEVLPLYQGIVREAYIKAGRLEDYREEDIYFQGEQQFAWIDATLGIMSRNKIAANIMVGGIHAEAIALGEVGNLLGAMQIAGTPYSPKQTGVFMALCDYVLIGEETFAAGAMLSNDVSQLGSLRVEDIFKGVLMGIIILGSILVSSGNDWLVKLFGM